MSQPQSPSLATPSHMTSGVRRVMARLAEARRTGGIGAMVRAVLAMGLNRVHVKLLDPVLALAPETRAVATATQLDGLTIKGRNRDQGHIYEPTPRLTLRWIFDLLPRDTRNWTFADVGAGRGRVVMVAAERPFKKVIGVEFAKELADDARENIAALPADMRAAGDIEILNEDAAEFKIPSGPCVFYIYNSFGAPVLRRFLENVMASHRKEPREIVIAYLNPTNKAVMSEFKSIKRRQLSAFTRLKLMLFSPHGLEVYDLTIQR